MDFLPICKEDLRKRGWPQLDIILVSGDAYVDHSSYGVAVIGRLLESKGYKVGIILQPNWRKPDDFLKLGKPRLFVGITSGNVDSMVANYSANKRLRKVDDYSPTGQVGLRPDRALIVYANKIREVLGAVPIVLGGIEASQRRLAHYDYWDNLVRRSVLIDAKADILVYGMGERPILEIADSLNKGKRVDQLNDIRGTVIIRKDTDFLKSHVSIPSFEEVSQDYGKFNQAFRLFYVEINPFAAKAVTQKHADRVVIQLPPSLPLNSEELDEIYELPYMRNWHPIYEARGGIKAFETVRNSLVSHRGCCGECSFCSLFSHQGRIVQSRSPESILKEARLISEKKDFRGTITDIGGPTVNLYQANCSRWEKNGFCEAKKCLTPEKCSNLQLGYAESLKLYNMIKALPRVKHVFLGSGFRHDLLIGEGSDQYLRDICKNFVSGQLKVAPEHVCDRVLRLMNKPSFGKYQKFSNKFREVNKSINKDQYLVNYFLSSHPGATLKDALEMALWLLEHKIHPEQIQDFIPLPMTVSTCMYWTEMNPFTEEKIYVPKTFKERKMQRALIQYRNPQNRKLIREALKQLGAQGLTKKFFRN